MMGISTFAKISKTRSQSQGLDRRTGNSPNHVAQVRSQRAPVHRQALIRVDRGHGIRSPTLSGTRHLGDVRHVRGQFDDQESRPFSPYGRHHGLRLTRLGADEKATGMDVGARDVQFEAGPALPALADACFERQP